MGVDNRASARYILSCNAKGSRCREGRKVRNALLTRWAAPLVAKIATGEITEEFQGPSGKTRPGKARARAEKLSQEERAIIAKKSAAQHWG
jgi:hypothetical protein